MKIAICDDNRDYINLFESYINRIKAKGLSHDVFFSGEELLYAYKNNQADYDVIFLDMEMNGMDGIDTAIKIREGDKHVIIVFVTSHTKYMQKSFVCLPFRFLVKPLAFEDFQKVYSELCERLKENPETFIFLENKKRTRIYCDDIVFFESNAHSLLIHLKNGQTHKTRKTMSELLDILNSNNFVRVHRAYVVNLSHIFQISQLSLKMHYYEHSVPVSRSHKDNLEEMFINFKERRFVL